MCTCIHIVISVAGPLPLKLVTSHRPADPGNAPSMQFSRNFKEEHVFPAHANVWGPWTMVWTQYSYETSTFREEEKEHQVERFHLPPSPQINSVSFSVYDSDRPLHKPETSKEGWAGGPGLGPRGCADKYLQRWLACPR